MLNRIKEKTWEILKRQQVSLAMICDFNGEILWHKGRDILGRTVENGSGFSKTPIKEAMKKKEEILKRNCIARSGNNLSKTAIHKHLKTTIIVPINGDFFLYFDSESKEDFSEKDINHIRDIADLFGCAIDYLRRRERSGEGILGKSKVIEEVREKVIKYAIEEEPILLTGETGVGKNYIAKHIHRNSGKDGEFLIVPIPNIPESLFESELFGFIKGAFTGASKSKKGLIEEADGGTLFLDEIAEVPMTFQSKLLEFIDTRQFRRTGSTESQKANVRIVAATNRELEKEVEKGRFREDLYHRLNCFRIHIPALRERIEDIKSIISANRELLKGISLSEGALEQLKQYEWPGNIRELLKVIRVASVEAGGKNKIDREIILKVLSNKRKLTIKKSKSDRLSKIKQSLKNGKNFWETAWDSFIKRDVDRFLMKELLKEYYRKNLGSFKKMIKDLNIKYKDYNKFMSLLYKYKIDPRK